MTRSVFETSSHGFASSSVRSYVVRPTNTKPGLLREKPEYPEGLDTPTTQADQGLWMSDQASQGSMPCDHGTKNWSPLGKFLCSTNRVRSRSGSSMASNAHPRPKAYCFSEIDDQKYFLIVLNPCLTSFIVLAYGSLLPKGTPWFVSTFEPHHCWFTSASL
jgi:hypothetical protein